MSLDTKDLYCINPLIARLDHVNRLIAEANELKNFDEFMDVNKNAEDVELWKSQASYANSCLVATRTYLHTLRSSIISLLNYYDTEIITEES